MLSFMIFGWFATRKTKKKKVASRPRVKRCLVEQEEGPGFDTIAERERGHRTPCLNVKERGQILDHLAARAAAVQMSEIVQEPTPHGATCV